MLRTIAISALALALAAADTWEVDSAHAYAVFRAKHLGTSFNYGLFTAVSGSIVTDADPAKSSVAIAIDPASISSGVAKRDEHLRGPDFLDVKQYKTAGFAGTGWKPAGENRWEVSGTLTLHGVAKPMTVLVAQTGSGTNPFTSKPIIGFETSFTIKQSDFGMNWAKDKGAVSDEVQLTISVEAQRK